MAQNRRDISAVLKRIRIGIAVIVLVLVGVLATQHLYLSPDPTQAELGGVGGTPDIGGDFELVSHEGQTVTNADFRGRYLLIYFGYTYCPDICPTSLHRNMEALDLIGDDANRIVPILVSIDPDRDTPTRLGEYVAFFDPRLVGLTGTPEQVSAAAESYRVFFAKVNNEDADGDTYLVDHSAFTYLVGPDGAFIAFFRHGVSSEEMAARLLNELK